MFKTNRIALCILLVLSVMSILNAQTKPNPKGIVGKINAKTYTYSEYNELFNNYCNYWQTKDGKKLTTERRQELNNQCWDELVGRAIYDAQIKKRNVVITDKEAYDSVMKTPPQQVKQIEALKTNGKFDKAKFAKAMEVDAKFKLNVLNLAKETMVYDKLFAVIKNEVKAKPDSVKQAWLKDNNLANARIIVFDYTKIPAIAVSDEEALNYYNEKKENYKKDPARKYRYVKLNQDLYADRTKAKAKADSIYNLLLTGGDFAALATQFSDDPGSGKNGGGLGWFTHERMVKPFADAAFGLTPNAISPPVKSQFGWHIIQTLEKRTNEQGKDEVNARHILIKSSPEESIKLLLTADADSLLIAAKAKGLAIAAAAKNYQVEETKEFYESSRSIQEFNGAVELIKTAFSNPIGYIPEIINDKNGDFYVCEISDSIGIHYSPFETEKANIIRTVERDKKIAANKTKAREFYSANQGKDFIEIATKDSMNIVDASDVKADASIPGIGSVKALTDSLLSAREGQYTSLIENDTNAYLALVTKRLKPALSDWEKQKTKKMAEANDKVKNSHLNNWYYKQRQTIKVDDYRKDFYELPKPKSNVQNIQMN